MTADKISQSVRSPSLSWLKAKALKLTLIYAAAGILWVFFSDMAVESIPGEKLEHVLQTLKGSLYVLGTAVLVYWLAFRAFQNIRRTVRDDDYQDAENLLNTIRDYLGDAVLVVDPQTRVIKSCNAALTIISGYSPQEVLGKSTEILHVDHDSYKQFAELSEPILEEKGVFRGRYHLKRKDGTIIITEHTVVTLHKELGWRQGVISIVRDITEKVRARKALQQSEERYRLLAENTLDVIWTMNRNLEFSYVNPAIKQLTGYTPEEFVGTRLEDHFDEKHLAPLQKIIARETAKGPDGQGIIFETEMLNRQGSPIPLRIHAKVIFDSHGEVGEFQGTASNITELVRNNRELEETKARLRKLTTHMNELCEQERTKISRDIHDNLGQVLTTLKMDLGWIEKRLSGDDQDNIIRKLEEMRTMIRDSVHEIKELCSWLRPSIIDDLGISAALEWYVEVFQEKSGIASHLNISPEVIQLDNDRSIALYRILQEALNNIYRHAEATRVDISLVSTDGSIMLKVVDNGRGISKEAIDAHESFGLMGMNERCLAFGGTFRIEKRDNGVTGTIMEATIPLHGADTSEDNHKTAI